MSTHMLNNGISYRKIKTFKTHCETLYDKPEEHKALTMKFSTLPSTELCRVLSTTYKKAQLSLTNPRDACEKFARFT